MEVTPPTSPSPLAVKSRAGTIDGCGIPGRSSPKLALTPISPVFAVDRGIDQNISATTIQCPFEVTIAKTPSGHAQIFGQGAWSKVYRATATSSPTVPAYPSPNTSVLTPPPSPAASQPRVLAVKTPISKASRTVLQHEAEILSHLSRTSQHEDYVIPFYGYLTLSASLVLGPVSLSLFDHLRACGGSSSTIEPVVGSVPKWLDLARKLVVSLAWLHDTAGVVHGDIKPGNILLAPDRTRLSTTENDLFPFNPLWIDFSSSYIPSSSGQEITTRNTTSHPSLSALTLEYTAPELLVSSVLRDPSSTATTASDVFSLAVTLLVSATGNLMVYPRGSNQWQRQYMAREGWNVLDFIEQGMDDNGGSRVPRGGVVERVVKLAVRKVDDGRIEARPWKEMLERISV